jgi:hypothetical protein
VTRSSKAPLTTCPLASTQSARSVPACQVTFGQVTSMGSTVLASVRSDACFVEVPSGFGTWSVPTGVPLRLKRTFGQLLKAFTVTAPDRFQW